MIDQFDILVTENNDDVTVNVTNNLEEVVDIFVAEGGEEIELNITNNIVEINIIRGAVNLSLTTNNNSGPATYDNLTGVFNIPNYTLAGLGGVPINRTLTINGTTFDLSANRSWTIPTHDAVTLGTANGLTLIGQQLSLGLASGSANGALSSTDWNTFNSKQNALNGTGFVKISGTTISYDNNTYALDSDVVKLTGAQTIAGIKTFQNRTDFSSSGIKIGTEGFVAPNQIYAEGTGRFFVNFSGAGHTIIGNSTGNVGIGTINPTQKLHVVGDVLFSNDLTVSGSILTNSIISNNINANLLIGTNSAMGTSIVFSTDFSERMRINATGNIGIGTTTPNSRLQVLGVSGDPTLNAGVAAISTFTPNGVGTELVMGSSASSPFTFWMQNRHTGINGLAYPIALNPLGGNVGIGTTSPVSKLHVNGGDITLWNSSDAILQFVKLGALAARITTTSNSLLFGIDASDGSTERMRITSSGNVGIGTTSPSNLLSVFGAQNSYLVNITGSSSTTVRGLTIGTYTSNGGGDCGVEFNAAINNTGFGSFRFSAGSNERMRIDTNGNVGIGTTSPTDRLEVSGAIRSNGLNGFIRINDGVLSASRADGLYLIQEANAPMIMWTNNTERMRITSGGNVGIGTTSPTARLSISANPGVDVLNVAGYDVLKWDSGDILTFGGYKSGQWNAVAFATTGAERLRITSSGNVGIGTTSPTSRLHVVGLPTSSAGLTAGAIWIDGTTLRIVI